MTGLRVLVCGGREYGYIPRRIPWGSRDWHAAKRVAEEERANLTAAMDRVLQERGISLLIHGAASGADELAEVWAKSKAIENRSFPAAWYPDGRSGGLERSAGPRRNQRMIDEGKPDLVVACKGGAGTADMLRRARAAGVEIIEVSG